jgi:hypothetical protein
MRTSNALSAADVPAVTQQTFLRKMAGTPLDVNGCRIWPFAVNAAGYGRLGSKIEGQPVFWLAHRLAYALCVGPIPAGVVVLHTCDVPACFDPTHLVLGTQADNQADMASKGRSTKGRPVGAALHNLKKERCKRGHADWRTNRDGSRSCRQCRRDNCSESTGG